MMKNSSWVNQKLDEPKGEYMKTAMEEIREIVSNINDKFLLGENINVGVVETLCSTDIVLNLFIPLGIRPGSLVVGQELVKKIYEKVRTIKILEDSEAKKYEERIASLEQEIKGLQLQVKTLEGYRNHYELEYRMKHGENKNG